MQKFKKNRFHFKLFVSKIHPGNFVTDGLISEDIMIMNKTFMSTAKDKNKAGKKKNVLISHQQLFKFEFLTWPGQKLKN